MKGDKTRSRKQHDGRQGDERQDEGKQHEGTQDYGRQTSKVPERDMMGDEVRGSPEPGA